MGENRKLLRNNREALEFLETYYGDRLRQIDEYKEERSLYWKGHRVGYILEDQQTGHRFFMRFRNVRSSRQRGVTFSTAQGPQQGWGYNKSEIEWQIQHDVYCLVVWSDGECYVVHPRKVWEWVEEHRSYKLLPDQAEPTYNVPESIHTKLEDFLGIAKPDFTGAFSGSFQTPTRRPTIKDRLSPEQVEMLRKLGQQKQRSE